MIQFIRYLMFLFTLFNGFGFRSSKKEKRETRDSTTSDSQPLSCSAPNRLPTSQQTKKRSTEKINGGKGRELEEEEVRSPASTTQPIAIASSKHRSVTTLRSNRTGGSAYSLHSATSAGSTGSRRLGHGTPRSGSKSAIGSFLTGSHGSTHACSAPRSAPRAYSKSHEAVWEQAYRNSCR
eukprot:gene16012-17629_t